ncbi:unnamed protein product, partial [Mesorhabditis belari]|uniref:Uncharacterized protein n=1 Tax=Mesorhabditis belari TaxID=2138241 RepID=A0AAF3EQQ7_9BILA
MTKAFPESLQVDLCAQINADIHGDLLNENEKEIIAYFLEAKINGYQVDAFKGEFDNGQRVDIVGLKGPQKFIVGSGVLSVRITRISENATSYHQLFTTDANVTVISDISDQENYGANHPFPKADSKKYILYQAAPSIDGNNGMELLFDGDCEHLSIWKGLVQSDSTELYGGTANTICGETYARDVLPRFVFTQYLTVQTRRPNNCTIYWLPKQYVADNELIAMYPATTGVLTSPEFNGPLDQDYLLVYNFQRENGVKMIYFTLFTPIVGDSELIFYEYDSSKTTKFTENDQRCHFESNESSVQIIYKWYCKELPCESGIVVK